MKTETQIAKENIELIEITSGEELVYSRGRAEEHFQSCQRFLEFLKKQDKFYGSDNKLIGLHFNFEQMIKDLQNAIKIYEDAGIK